MRVEEKKTQNKQNQIYLHNNVEFSKKAKSDETTAGGQTWFHIRLYNHRIELTLFTLFHTTRDDHVPTSIRRHTCNYVAHIPTTRRTHHNPV